MKGQEVEGLLAVTSLDHLLAELLEHVTQGGARIRVVVDDQNMSRSGAGSSSLLHLISVAHALSRADEFCTNSWQHSDRRGRGALPRGSMRPRGRGEMWSLAEVTPPGYSR